MKKVVVLVLVAVLVFSLTGCAAPTVRTGLGVVTSTGRSSPATAEEPGRVQVDSTVAAVTIDGDGKILTVDIDAPQTRVGFDATGALVGELSADVPTKGDLGADYGMKEESGIGREWYEQIEELEKWYVGKTAAEISAMQVVDGATTEADLTSSVTITVTNINAAVLEAIQTAN